MASAHPRQYDLLVLGATGYTGKLCAEYITSSLPTDLKWGVAGRSEAKLSVVVDGLKALNSDRLLPGIEVTALRQDQLSDLAKKTRLMINTIGPYHLYSTPVVEACANNGTHYLDVTGETPWTLEMIRKYHDTAELNHAIMIPQIGIESAPSDLVAWSLTDLIRRNLSTGTKEIVSCVYDVKGAPSGGTLATILSIFDHYSLQDFAESSGTWASSPVPHPKSASSESLLTKLTGVLSTPELGVLTTSITKSNTATVQRSWGLLDGGKLYGPRFQYYEYMAVRNYFVGVAVHFMIAFCELALVIPPVRWLLKKLVYAPGHSSTKEAASKEAIEYRAIATADQDGPNPKRAMCKLRWDGGLYYLTGVFLAEAAMVILKEQGIENQLGGGLLTPATLGQPFINRLKKAGLVLETEMLSDQ